MSEDRIYVEGGSDALATRCREGFRKLLEKAGFTGRIPRIVACGGRDEAYDDFENALASGKYAHLALIVDSEDPVQDIEKTWEHLKARDGWERPPGADDAQVFLMTTCMETWIVADRDSLGSITKTACKSLPCRPQTSWSNATDTMCRID